MHKFLIVIHVKRQLSKLVMKLIHNINNLHINFVLIVECKLIYSNLNGKQVVISFVVKIHIDLVQK